MQLASGRAALLNACALALLGSGCVSYVAPLRREVQRGELEVTVEAVEGKPAHKAYVVLSIERTPSGLSLLAAYVNAPAASPCAEGMWARAWGRSDAHDAQAALSEGEQITLELPEEALKELSSAPSRLDLLVRTREGNTRCIPIPITDSAHGLLFEPVQRFTLGVDLGLEGFTSSLGSVSQIIDFPIELGVWFDRVHLMVGGGFAGAGCPDTRCPVTDDSDAHIDYSSGYTANIGADTVLWEGGEIGVGAGLRYRVAYLTADTFAGQDSEKFWMHGPVIAPAFLVVMPVLQPQRIGGSHDALAAFEVPIGYAMAGRRGSALSFGFTLRFQFTLW